ncbi:MAG: hypothetical protein JO254_04385 [Pseudolabrys sp.]|nr:hypothetical protein [Pseudolabrys sp.]
MRLWIVLAAAFLSGCAADPVTSPLQVYRVVGKWRFETATDRTTGQTLSGAMLAARSTHSDEPFSKEALLQLMCFRNEPVVRFAFELKIGSERNVEFSYRFDDRPGRQATVHIARDYTVATIEDENDVRTFVDDLKSSRKLYVLIRSLNAGRATVEFELDGAPEAIAQAYATCPIKPPEPPKPPKRRR